MRTLVLTTLAAFAASCSSPQKEAAEAQKRFELARTAGDEDEMCRQARQVAQVWLTAGDQQKYSQAKATRDVYCDEPALRRAAGL